MGTFPPLNSRGIMKITCTFFLLLLHMVGSNPQIYSLDIGFGSEGSSVAIFPTQSSTVIAAQENHHRFGRPTQQTFRSQGGQGGQDGQGGQGGKQAEHDEALRQNALHRQMLAEVEKKHREATQAALLRVDLGTAEETGRQTDPFAKPRKSQGGKTLDIFLKKKSDLLPKKKLRSKSSRKELLSHLTLVAKLEAEVDRLFLRSLRLEAGDELEEEGQPRSTPLRRRPHLADPRKQS